MPLLPVPSLPPSVPDDSAPARLLGAGHPAARLRAAIAAWERERPFRPARGLGGGHAQTCWPTVGRRPPVPAWTRARVGMEDGGAVSVYRIAARPGRPTLLLLHGLEGSVRSHYVLGMAERFAARGWGVAALAFRTCDGDAPGGSRMYHSGETRDVAAVARWLREEAGVARLFVAGFSLGANVAGKWVAEQGESPVVEGAALVSAPYDLGACAVAMDRVLGGLYAGWFLRPLRRKAAAFAAARTGVPFDAARVARCRTIVGYDDLVTAPLHGFEGAWDYYARSSSGPRLGAARVPTLLVSSADDPIIPASAWPREAVAANPWLVPAWTTRGGHLGFFAGGRDGWWAEATIERAFVALAGEA